jgi:hypothetical protein
LNAADAREKLKISIHDLPLSIQGDPRMPKRTWLTALALTLFTAAQSFAQSQQGAAATPAPAPPPTPPPACSAPEYRQFDFWLGEWNVVGPMGGQAGVNRIEATLGGCVIQEHWQGTGGANGSSFNIYQASDKSWNQIWVDNRGNLLVLKGGMKDGKMDMEGDTTRPSGGTNRNRVTWEPLGKDKLRQVWTTSSDGGKTWNTVFDGTYTRKP